jgi:tetratricopeptide (TPR) repeat protein
MTTYSTDREFVELLRPILETGDLDLLTRHIHEDWPNTRLRELLFGESRDATKVALFCLSLAGTMEDCPAVACLLRHEDPFISDLAENTMWSIWFRSGGEQANRQLRRAIQLAEEARLNEARRLLGRLIDQHPEFAEAYNQRAILCFLSGHYVQARRDLIDTLRRNPTHFAALAGLGHCYAAEGKWQKALSWYKRAAQIHPTAEGLQEAIDELKRLFIKLRTPPPPAQRAYPMPPDAQPSAETPPL